MTQIKIKIPAELEPAAVGGMVTDSKYVKDRVKNKTQEEVNADTEERLSTLEESVGTGGSVDERIAVEKNRAEQAEGVLDGKVAAEKQRAEGVEGGLNTRLQTVEQLAEISVGGGDIGIGTAADFESDDPEDLAKVPTIGAMLGGANDGVYDISARHSGTKYADLAAALGTDGANVPVGVRKGGMSVKFVQSSDNKYVQYRLMADTFSTTVGNWQGVDDEPIAGSENLVKSNSLYRIKQLSESSYKSIYGVGTELGNLEAQIASNNWVAESSIQVTEEDVITVISNGKSRPYSDTYNYLFITGRIVDTPDGTVNNSTQIGLDFYVPENYNSSSAISTSNIYTFTVPKSGYFRIFHRLSGTENTSEFTILKITDGLLNEVNSNLLLTSGNNSTIDSLDKTLYGNSEVLNSFNVQTPSHEWLSDSGIAVAKGDIITIEPTGKCKPYLNEYNFLYITCRITNSIDGPVNESVQTGLDFYVPEDYNNGFFHFINSKYTFVVPNSGYFRVFHRLSGNENTAIFKASKRSNGIFDGINDSFNEIDNNIQELFKHEKTIHLNGNDNIPVIRTLVGFIAGHTYNFRLNKNVWETTHVSSDVYAIRYHTANSTSILYLANTIEDVPSEISIIIPDDIDDYGSVDIIFRADINQDVIMLIEDLTYTDNRLLTFEHYNTEVDYSQFTRISSYITNGRWEESDNSGSYLIPIPKGAERLTLTPNYVQYAYAIMRNDSHTGSASFANGYTSHVVSTVKVDLDLSSYNNGTYYLYVRDDLSQLVKRPNIVIKKSSDYVTEADLMQYAQSAKLYNKALKTYKGTISTLDYSQKLTTNIGDFWINNYIPSDRITVNIAGVELFYGDILLYGGSGYQRVQIPTIPTSLNKTNIYDVCIIGGGAGAIGAAWALKDYTDNLSVCIVDSNPMLGGTHTEGMVVDFCCAPGPKFFKQDIYDKLVANGFMRKWDKTTVVTPSDDDIYWQTELQFAWAKGDSYAHDNTGSYFYSRDALVDIYMKELSSIDIKQRHEFVEVDEYEVSNGKASVKSVKVKNIETGSIFTIKAKVFIDNTDGALIRNVCDKMKGSSALGEDYFLGDDSKTTYNESAYIDGHVATEGNISTPDLSYRIGIDFNNVEDVDFLPNMPELDRSPNIIVTDCGNTNYILIGPDVITGSNLNDFIDALKTGGAKSYWETASNIAKGNWRNIKEQGTIWGGDYSDYRLTEISNMMCQRESFRMNCETMLTQQDTQNIITTLTDIVTNKYVAISRWDYDMHGSAAYRGINGINSVQEECYGVPMGCLIPKKLSNVLIASHSLGASHIAQATCRITKTMMFVGNAAGYMAYEYLKHGLNDFRNVNVTHVQSAVELSERIRYIEENCYPQDPHRDWNAQTKTYGPYHD